MGAIALGVGVHTVTEGLVVFRAQTLGRSMSDRSDEKENMQATDPTQFRL